jgi:hypothetical protein
LIDTNDCVEAIIKFGSGALDDDADKRAATVELLGRAAPASLAEAIERMTANARNASDLCFHAGLSPLPS